LRKPRWSVSLAEFLVSTVSDLVQITPGHGTVLAWQYCDKGMLI